MSKSSESFALNDRVHHAAFGVGTIRELSERYVTIVFDEGGRKKFLNGIVQIERSSSPLPVKAVRAKKVKVKAAK